MKRSLRLVGILLVIILSLLLIRIPTKVKASTGIDITWNQIVNREYYIKNAYSGRYLDVAGGIASNGTNVQQYEYNGTASQRWKLKGNSDSTVTILSALSYTYALDIENGSNATGANLQIYQKNGTTAQKFQIEIDSHFTISLRSGAANYNKPITIANGSYTNETNVNQTTVDGSDYKQRWILEPVSRYGKLGEQYAFGNWDNFMHAYPNCDEWGGDCTNFVSQCLNAGGIHMRNNWIIYRNNDLYPKPSNFVQLNLTWGFGGITAPKSWINAGEFYQYWTDSSLTSKVSSLKGGPNSLIDSNWESVLSQANLRVGDIVQLATVDENGVYAPFHSLVVVQVKTNDYILACHTKPSKTKSFRYLVRKYKDCYIVTYRFN